ncbi:MAG: DUF956 family protein [Lachnospiraceae bacterium]|nr:DUF956 family protein [Lachnospiraceae bacterium]
MAESMNTKADLVVNGISYMGLNNYGKIMVGDKAFEFYNDRDPNDYIQIPWEEIEYIVADLVFGGKWIPRFAIETRQNGTYRFGASRETKRLLSKCRDYFPAERIVRAKSAIGITIDSIRNILHKGGK